MLPLEKTILRQLFADQEFAERVLPYLNERYFHSNEAATIFKLIHRFYDKYTVVPTFTAVNVALDSSDKMSEAAVKAAKQALSDVQAEATLPDSQKPWLLEQTEEYCQDRAIYCALQDAIQVMDDPNATRHVIPDLMKDALAVSFDQNIGHDFFDNAADRYDFYHLPQARMPFDIDLMNRLTRGGTPRKTLNVILAGTNVGKSLALVHFTAGWLRMSKNVLYLTFEMAEERIAERVDANMMDIPLDDVMALPRQQYLNKINHLRQTSTGRLVVKEYAPGVCHAGMIRTLLRELKMKQNWSPDIIVVDYLTIMASSRVKLNNQGVNGFTYFKYVSEELRGLGVEEDVGVWTAAQFNRTGHSSTDPGLEHVGESFGIVQTADFAIALVSTEELEKLGQLMAIELKNRYAKRRSYDKHLLGVDTTRMKLYDLNSTQMAQGLSASASSGGTAVGPAPMPQGSLSRRRQLSPLSSLKKEHEDDDPV